MEIYSWAINLPRQVANWIGNLFRFVTGQFTAGVISTQQTGGPVGPAERGGGQAPGAGGGRTPVKMRSKGGSIWGDVEYASKGKQIQGRFRNVGTDSVPTMLTPGEFVLRRRIVAAVGPQNLQALNDGLISYQDLLARAMQNPKRRDQQIDEKNAQRPSALGTGVSGMEMSFGLAGGGLAGTSARPRSSAITTGTTAGVSGMSSVSVDRGFTVENLTIQNPVPETASDSLPRSIRKIGYLRSGGRRSD